jgi:hypothetical protein
LNRGRNFWLLWKDRGFWPLRGHGIRCFRLALHPRRDRSRRWGGLFGGSGRRWRFAAVRFEVGRRAVLGFAGMGDFFNAAEQAMRGSQFRFSRIRRFTRGFLALRFQVERVIFFAGNHLPGGKRARLAWA